MYIYKTSVRMLSLHMIIIRLYMSNLLQFIQFIIYMSNLFLLFQTLFKKKKQFYKFFNYSLVLLILLFLISFYHFDIFENIKFCWIIKIIIGNSSMISNVAKNFDILAISLNVLYHYFDSLKLFLNLFL